MLDFPLLLLKRKTGLRRITERLFLNSILLIVLILFSSPGFCR